MKITPTLVHAASDYVMASLLLAAPWLFGFAHDGNAMTCTMTFGGVLLLYSLFTDYELAIRRVIPLAFHAGLDAVLGGLLIAAPFLGGFSETVWVPHLVLGCVEAAMAVGFALYLGIAALLDRLPRRQRLAH